VHLSSSSATLPRHAALATRHLVPMAIAKYKRMSRLRWAEATTAAEDLVLAGLPLTHSREHSLVRSLSKMRWSAGHDAGCVGLDRFRCRFSESALASKCSPRCVRGPGLRHIKSSGHPGLVATPSCWVGELRLTKTHGLLIPGWRSLRGQERHCLEKETVLANGVDDIWGMR
jgi:hypothetical protein